MFYILSNEATYSVQPDIDYGGGTSMQFKHGLFLFDSDDKSVNFYVNTISNRVEVGGTSYLILHAFKSPIKAKIIFFNMKKNEMEKNGYSTFMVNRYNKFIEKNKDLVENYPEYVV